MVNPIAAVANGFKNYANFTGRSTRAEFWWWYLFSMVSYIIVGIISATALPHVSRVVPSTNPTIQPQTYESPNLILVSLFSIALLIPTLALVVRRLRDAGYYWAWIFIAFVPFVGGIWLIVLYCMPSAAKGWGQPTAADSGPVQLPRQYY